MAVQRCLGLFDSWIAVGALDATDRKGNKFLGMEAIGSGERACSVLGERIRFGGEEP